MKASTKPPREQMPGAYMPDGSYFADAGISQRGPTDHFVRAMVKSRCGPAFPPHLASEAVTLAKQVVAFPNWRQWAEAPGWSFVWTSTSAEEAVKRCGVGFVGHWCEELWAEGPESACSDPGHRQEDDRARVTALVASVGKRLSDPVADHRAETASSTPDATVLTPANEAWFKRQG
jgi:hypothetical protein